MPQSTLEKNTVSSSTRVDITGLTKKFGATTAVDNANITIENGEFMTLLGPSGCGKTTILSMLLGILDSTSGTITFDGESINQVPMNKRDVGMVFQNYALFPHMTVSQNIAFGLDMRKINKAEKKRRVEEALEMVQLNGLGDRFTKELSGGQQQRVALARALVIRPKVLLLDEPLSNLDAKLRKDMRIQLKRLHDELGITTLYVTHDQEEALSLSSKVVVMSKGVIQQIGTPKEIFGNPRNYFVANFVGYSNFFTGKLVDKQGDKLVFESEDSLRLLVDDDNKHNIGDNVMVTIKPEMLEIADPDATGINYMDGSILVSDYVGSTTGYEVQVGAGRILKVNVLGLNPYSINDKIKLYFNPKNILIIDKE